MASVKELYYDIESMFIDGVATDQISRELACPIEYVQTVLASMGVVETQQEEDEIYSPYYGA
jgi:hypothetical protein